MQCASSIAIRHGLRLREHLREARHAQPLRRDEEEVELAVEVVEADLARGRAVAAGVDALGREARARCSFATWSSISAISGLTTSVVPPRAMPGSW